MAEVIAKQCLGRFCKVVEGAIIVQSAKSKSTQEGKKAHFQTLCLSGETCLRCGWLTTFNKLPWGGEPVIKQQVVNSNKRWLWKAPSSLVGIPATSVSCQMSLPRQAHSAAKIILLLQSRIHYSAITMVYITYNPVWVLRINTCEIIKHLSTDSWCNK